MDDRLPLLHAEPAMHIDLSADSSIDDLAANIIRFTVTRLGSALSAELVPLQVPSPWRNVTRASIAWLCDADIIGTMISIDAGDSDWMQLLSFVAEGFGPDAGRGLRELQQGEWDHIELMTPDLDHGPRSTLIVTLDRNTRLATVRSDSSTRPSARLNIPEGMLTLEASTVAAAMTAAFVIDANPSASA